MHARCSRSTLASHYHAGSHGLPRRLRNRLLVPPRGRTVVGMTGHQVVAVGQLISTGDPAVGEVSLLVEDDWQAQGIGAALLVHLVRAGRAAGHTELVGWCVPGERGPVRTAGSAGFPVSTRFEDELMRVSIGAIRDVDPVVAGRA
jgi:GNAT superfamily N-acetyltransferase